MKLGGSARVEIGGETRLLMHDPSLDQAPAKLPWPLSAFQPHQVTYAIYHGGTCVTQERFERGGIETAIDKFLSGIPADENVLVMIEN